ncbi:MAG: D-glucuronyl C5-epimerase family protein [Ignavibacteriaceae bacterium]|nr:D-glucuronyl C5-epimerase family protein [Ignavibacteriaceae bacterium]
MPEYATYWHTITPCAIDSKPDELGKYYLDFSSKYYYPGKFDGKGIPIYEFPDKRAIYHPIVICQYAFALFELLFKSNYSNKTAETQFLIQADWLLKSGSETKKGLVWYIDYSIKEYGLYQPWFSALAQGEAISVLTRAYKLTSNIDFIKACDKAIIPFTLQVKSGGLVNLFKNIPVYEEYPSPIRTVAVLNGFIFSLFGLYDYYLSTKNSLAKELFENGIDSLTKILPYYDIKYWSSYYLFDYPKSYTSSFTYHNIMINQLKALSIISNEKIFSEYSNKWESYKNSNYYKTKALIRKILFSRKLKV